MLTYLGAGTTSSVMGKLTFSRAWELSFSRGAMWYQIKVFEHNDIEDTARVSGFNI